MRAPEPSNCPCCSNSLRFRHKKSDKEKYRKYRRDYYKNNKDHIRNYQKDYYHNDEVKTKRHDWYVKNKERILAEMKAKYIPKKRKMVLIPVSV